MTVVSRAVLEALASVTTLPRPILKAQCELLGYHPHSLETHHLDALVPKLLEAVGRFGSPAKVKALRVALISVGGFESIRTTEPVRDAVKDAVKESPASGYRRVANAAQLPLGAFARSVQNAMAAHSPLGWSLLEAQCERHGQRASALTPETLAALIPELERSLMRFGSPASAEETRAALERLIRRAS